MAGFVYIEVYIPVNLALRWIVTEMKDTCIDKTCIFDTNLIKIGWKNKKDIEVGRYQYIVFLLWASHSEYLMRLHDIIKV